jgi:hypothetical protein
MRKIIAPAVAGLALTLTPLALAAPAEASTPGCVDRAEYRQIKKGTGIKKVHRVLNTKGRQTMSGFGMQFRDYKACTDREYGFVSLTFERKRGAWVLQDKFAYWGI